MPFKPYATIYTDPMCEMFKPFSAFYNDKALHKT